MSPSLVEIDGSQRPWLIVQLSVICAFVYWCQPSRKTKASNVAKSMHLAYTVIVEGSIMLSFIVSRS